jgi:dethiobiotin synthetase
LSRIIFVTGTDTGVGKTLLTALLLCHLRESGVVALAMKPFCSGGTEDVDLIQAIQGSAPPREEVNPFYFPEPVAPLIAARKRRWSIRLAQVLRVIQRMERRCECLIVEGSGGVLVPLGEGFTVADVIARLECDVILVGRNRLGTINHTLLTAEALQSRRVRQIKVILMGQSTPDISARSNAAMLEDALRDIEVVALPYLGAGATRAGLLKRKIKKIKKTLARIADPDSFSPRSSARETSKPKGLKKRKKDR